MRFLGAKVVLTPRAEKGLGMYKKAKELADKNGWFLAHQFETNANADIHEATTGQEIINDFREKKLDYFVTGYGTGGTIAGVARVLRQHSPETKIVLSEPDVAPIVGSKHAQERNVSGEPVASHPHFQPHPIQGWTPDFIPLVLQEAIDKRLFDELLPVTGKDGIYWSKQLAVKEGIFTGVSGGASLAVAMDVAKNAQKGSVILAMLPDTGERYLSTPLFDDIETEMSEEEISLSKSTPGFQM
jgi:cysteine synthase A